MAANAEKTVTQAFKALWDIRVKMDLADPERDPMQSGVIGIEASPITTTLGYPEAKELSALPGWAGWLVRELSDRGIYAGADVAASFTGSFPGINIAVLAALKELGVDVKAISSVGASSWGANEPELTWLDMEVFLREKGILKVGSNAVTIGGSGDRGAEWGEYAYSLALDAVKRSRLPFIKPLNLRDAVKQRMLFYGSPRDYFCYINVGGGQASLGGGSRVRFDRGGWFYEPLTVRGSPDGVMDRLLDAGLPCLNFLYLESLNQHYKIVKK